MKKLCVLLFLTSALCSAQSAREPGWFVSLYSGATLGETRWSFLLGDRLVPVHPMFGVGAGIGYGPIVEFGGAHLLTSIELGYGGITTGEHDNDSDPFNMSNSPPHTVQMKIERIPVMLWLTLSASGTITPFIRGGLGMSRTDFTEEYSDPKGPTVHFHDWGFTWGIGGGVDARLGDDFSLSLFLDDWVNVDDIRESVPGSDVSSGIYAPVKLTLVGIRGILSL